MLLYDSSSVEIAMGIAQMPHAWSEGTEIVPHVHWTPTNDNDGAVIWQLEYQIASVGEAFNFTDGWTPVLATDTGGGVVGEHRIAAFDPIDMAGYRISCCIHWKLSRLADDVGDTYDADARLIEFDIHYQINTLGSRLEFIK
jgi:hypothetical protein